MQDFQSWMSNNHPELFNENIGLWMRSNRKWIAPAVLAASSYLPAKAYQNQPSSNQPAQVSADDVIVNGVADYIRKQYDVNIYPHQVDMISPSEAISPMYGTAWNKVRQDATNAGSSKVAGMDMGVQIPNAAAMDMNKLDAKVPVVFADPTLFGQKDTVQGFCSIATVNGKPQKFCVVRDRQSLSTIRHELSHATQNFRIGGTLGDAQSDDFFNSYLMQEAELGVRLAEMKRNYYQFTGIIVTSQKDSFLGMIEHFLRNPQLYSADVQQLLPTIHQARQEGKLKLLIQFMQDHIDRVVTNSPKRTNTV